MEDDGVAQGEETDRGGGSGRGGRFDVDDDDDDEDDAREGLHEGARARARVCVCSNGATSTTGIKRRLARACESETIRMNQSNRIESHRIESTRHRSSSNTTRDLRVFARSPGLTITTGIVAFLKQ